MQRSRKSFKELVNITPKVASVKRGEMYVETQIDEIKIGDVVLVKSGERIGVDGLVIKGHSSVNQAPITGESLPVCSLFLCRSLQKTMFVSRIPQEQGLHQPPVQLEQWRSGLI